MLTRPIAVLDVETDPFLYGRDPKPFVADFFDGKRHRIFWGDDCMDKLHAECRKFKGTIYAHNGGKFDFHFLLNKFDPTIDRLTAIKSRIAKWKTPTCEFRDSWLILPVALKQLDKEEFDYTLLEKEVRSKPENRKRIISYLKSDCEYLYEHVEHFIEEYGYGLTLAGRAFHILKKHFNIVPPKSNISRDDQFRRFYYGGRVEFYKLGSIEGPVTCVDINSAYPRAMIERHAFGVEFTRFARPLTGDNFRRSFYRVTGENNGALPAKDEKGRLVFTKPHGEFFVTGWELEAALDLRLFKVEKYHEILVPNETQDFKSYVDHFYTLKNRNPKESVTHKHAKLFLNSPYGRFAMNPREFKDVDFQPTGKQHPENVEIRRKWENDNREKIRLGLPLLDDPVLPWNPVHEFPNTSLTLWERESDPEKATWFNVATAASITGHVRATMLRALHSVKDPYYCDTDSIFCRETGKLKIGSDLGEWKVEGKFERLDIAGKKLYAAYPMEGFKEKTACKGVKLTAAQISEVAKGGKITYRFDAPNFSLFSLTKWTERNIVRADRINPI